MTIHDFEWSMFWETRHFVSWLEIGALICFNLAWVLSIFKTVSSKQTDGKSALASLLVAVGLALGACYKLFINLDVDVLGYLLGACLGVLDFVLTRRMQGREVDATTVRREKLLEKADKHDEKKSSRRSSHSHGAHERSHERSSSESSHEHSHEHEHEHAHERSHRHGGHEHSHDESASGEAKEPKFGDDLKLD